jgi:hypothetical protein
MDTTLRRGVVALTTALACLVLLAGPASAAVVNGTITGGTITLVNSTGTSTDTISLPSGTPLGTGCASSFTVDISTTGTSATNWRITGFASISRFPVGTSWFIADLSWKSSTSGTVTGPATLNSSGLALDLRIWNATNQSSTATDCGTTTLKCRFATVNLNLQGTYSGNIHSPAASDTINLTALGALGSPFPCTSPFSTYHLGTTTITGLVLHV